MTGLRQTIAAPPVGWPASRVTILGIPIQDLGFDDAVATLRAAVNGSERRTLFFVNAHTLDLASRSATFHRVLRKGDLVFGDGTGVRWAARLQGVRLKANLNGTDLIPAFMEAADGDGLSYFLLGATPAVLSRTADVLQTRVPGWRLVGQHHGFLEPAASHALIGEIAAARPHLLLVAMGNPLQEEWIAAHRERLDAVLVAGVGGLFAYLSGEYSRAPIMMRRLGLEWLAILFMQHHKRRRYLVGAPTFLLRVCGERILRRYRS